MPEYFGNLFWWIIVPSVWIFLLSFFIARAMS